MGQSQRLRPPRATEMPPKMPPNVSPMIPTVPCTNPTSSVVSPKPPFSIGSSKKGIPILANWASGSRYSSMNAMATVACFFWKKVVKVVKNSFINPEADTSFAGWSAAGWGRMKRW